MRHDTCAKCQYCEWHDEEGEGECKRFPPVYVCMPDPVLAYPQVAAEDWCGEFRTRLQ